MTGDTLGKFRIDGRVAVVTGGAGFLGVQHAEAILDAGGVPVLLDLDGRGAARRARELSLRYGKEVPGIAADITKKESVAAACRKVLDTHGRVDILINNAARDPKVTGDPGEPPWSRFEGLPEAEWRSDLEVGLTGAFLCSQAFGQVMAEAGKGVILNIASDLGLIAPDQRIYRKEGLPEELQPVKPAPYSVAKHGLIGLTRYLATYWAPRGIRVNALCPGGVYRDQPAEFVEKLTNLIPLGRMAEPGEYKPAVLFLVSDASSYMTGSLLVIDGGRTCW